MGVMVIFEWIGSKLIESFIESNDILAVRFQHAQKFIENGNNQACLSTMLN